MAKKVKCAECANSMHWALPERVLEQNYDYAKWCLCIGRGTIVCDATMKSRPVRREQYCKRYRPKTEWDKKYDEMYSNELLELENKIKQYEQMKERGIQNDQ